MLPPMVATEQEDVGLGGPSVRDRRVPRPAAADAFCGRRPIRGLPDARSAAGRGPIRGLPTPDPRPRPATDPRPCPTPDPRPARRVYARYEPGSSCAGFGQAGRGEAEPSCTECGPEPVAAGVGVALHEPRSCPARTAADRRRPPATDRRRPPTTAGDRRPDDRTTGSRAPDQWMARRPGSMLLLFAMAEPPRGGRGTQILGANRDRRDGGPIAEPDSSPRRPDGLLRGTS